MNSVLYRVDDRLVHGQITVSWVPFLRATRIVIADNQVPDNPLQMKILQLATPPELRLEILPIRRAVALLEQQRSGPGLVTIMLFSGLKAVEQALEDGLSLTELNLGNLHNATGKLRISDSISLNRNEIACLYRLREGGLKITIQPVPGSETQDVFAVLRRKGL